MSKPAKFDFVKQVVTKFNLVSEEVSKMDPVIAKLAFSALAGVSTTFALTSLGVGFPFAVGFGAVLAKVSSVTSILLSL